MLPYPDMPAQYKRETPSPFLLCCGSLKSGPSQVSVADIGHECVSGVLSVSFRSYTMRVELVLTVLVFLIGLGYSFKITDLFGDSTFHDTQRQSTVEDQILPVFMIAFFASLFNSLVFGLQNHLSAGGKKNLLL